MYPIRYWVHDESDTVFKTRSPKEEKAIQKDVDAGQVVEINYEEYQAFIDKGYSHD